MDNSDEIQILFYANCAPFWKMVRIVGGSNVKHLKIIFLFLVINISIFYLSNRIILSKKNYIILLKKKI
jgi:hypothetical protein